jgi:L-2-hydroxyglutarate oxidase LhgO
MEKVEFLIIGAGAVGLAVGWELSKRFDNVVIVEQEDTFGRHTSSRNSEVIHSGIYYPTGSLKAKLCVEGNKILYDFCQQFDISYQKIGKLVIAAKPNEIDYLNWLQANSERNGVKNTTLLSQEEIQQIEPEIRGLKALLVPGTGILDTHSFMKKLENLIQKKDNFVIYGMQVFHIEKKSDSYLVHFQNGETWQAKWLINSAGLNCEAIANMLAIDTEKEKLKIHYCKGEYYKLSTSRTIQRLIYPVPDKNGIFLGIHLTKNLNGEIRFGPNAYYVDKVSYQFDETYKNEFVKAIGRYMPIEADEIHPDDCGIRPKLQGINEEFRDFYIQEETERFLPNYIQLMGIESPGLTASLAIGKFVSAMVK